MIEKIIQLVSDRAHQVEQAKWSIHERLWWVALVLQHHHFTARRLKSAE